MIIHTENLHTKHSYSYMYMYVQKDLVLICLDVFKDDVYAYMHIYIHCID